MEFFQSFEPVNGTLEQKRPPSKGRASTRGATFVCLDAVRQNLVCSITEADRSDSSSLRCDESENGLSPPIWISIAYAVTVPPTLRLSTSERDVLESAARCSCSECGNPNTLPARCQILLSSLVSCYSFANAKNETDSSCAAPGCWRASCSNSRCSGGASLRRARTRRCVGECGAFCFDIRGLFGNSRAERRLHV